MKRVVVTGLGAITPLGNNVSEFWDNLVKGTCGIKEITKFDTTNYKVKLAAEVHQFDPLQYMDKMELRHTDLYAQYAMAAACQAMEDSGIQNTIAPERIGVYMGSGIGGMSTFMSEHTALLEKGPRKVSPYFIPMMIANMASGQVSITFGLQGPVLTDVTACASGTNAIGLAARLIKHGDADVMIAGGTEAAVAKTPMAGFAAMKALSSRECPPEEASCPFDARRDGFVLGEGAGILVLEELEHAKKRGAYIYAELAGYGSNGDAYHITAPRPGGEVALRCMQKALADARIDPKDVDYINAHGTSTHLNDLNESTAIKALLGQHAYEIPVNSTKSMTGHLLGAAGAIEAVVCVLTIEKNRVHPTINRKEIDPDCDLDYVTDGARDVKVNVAMSNSFGFGGHNAVIVMRRYEE